MAATKPKSVDAAPYTDRPLIDLQLVDPGNGNTPTIVRGVSHSPWAFEERHILLEESGYSSNLKHKASDVMDRAFATVAKDFSNLPKFSKSNRLCVVVWIEPATGE